VKLRTIVGAFVGVCVVASLIFLGFQSVRYLWVLTTPGGRAFLQALYEIHENHLSQPKSSALFDAAIGGMTTQLNDPFTAYQMPLDDKGSTNLLVNGIGEIGLRITSSNSDGTGREIANVRSISPAAEVGIRPDDILLKIEGQPTATMSTIGIVQKMLGPKGSICTVVIQRGLTKREFKLIRDNVYDKTVVAFKLEADIGYIRISDFLNRKTFDQVKNALQELRSSGARKLVLDLRDNGGGRIDQATAVADLLLGKGAIFITRDRNGVVTTQQRAALTPDDDMRPLVVLVNHGTASSSEIFAAALQSNARARLIGEITYGKGTAETESYLANSGKLILGTTEWLTPNGKNVSNHGLEPDLKIADTRFKTPVTFEAKHLPPGAKIVVNTQSESFSLVANAKGEVRYSANETWVNWGAPQDVLSVKRDAQLQAALNDIRLEPLR
jgi:carboxyl-terminal processing protease